MTFTKISKQNRLSIHTYMKLFQYISTYNKFNGAVQTLNSKEGNNN